MEKIKRISKDLTNLTGNENNSSKTENEDDEGIEELDTVFIKTEQNFRMGNESSSKYDFSPKEVLDEYQEFN